MNNPTSVAEQYASEQNLRVRIETHRPYSVGESLEARVDQTLNLKGDEEMLDVGTGPGDFLGRLAGDHKGRLVGVDLSAGMIQKAQDTYPQVEFLQADAMNLPFPDGSFDVVSARHMLYHLPDMAKALSECRRVLRPGGKFLAVTNADGYMAEFWQAVAEAVEGDSAFDYLLDEIHSPKFFSAHLKGLIEACFGNAQMRLLEGALEFPEVAPVLVYWDSIHNPSDAPLEAWQRAQEGLGQVLKPRFAQGPWRVAKALALITASV